MRESAVPITSRHNPLLQEIRKAVSTGRPTTTGLLVAEGPHLVEEVQGSNWTVEQVVVTSKALERFRDLAERTGNSLVVVEEAAFSAAASTETTQGILALVRPPQHTWADLFSPPALLLVLDGVQDPGNAGTALRSADAFGGTGIVLSRTSVKRSNQKFLRATAGSAFRIPTLENVPPEEISRQLVESGITVYALSAQGHIALHEADFSAPCALVVGSEGSGVSPALQRNAAGLRIPAERVESLNAGVACSIALYVAARQRGAQS